MRILVTLGASTMALIPHAASADVFAITCTGTSTAVDTFGGRQVTHSGPLPEQTYVIDSAAKKVTRALKPRQEFEDQCSVVEASCVVDISPGLIRIEGRSDKDEPSVTASLEISRVTGKAERRFDLDYRDGRYHHLSWSMVCKKGPIPVFDTNKNKF